MTDNIVEFPINTALEGADVLRNIIEEDDPDRVFVICWPKDGGMPTYHSNTNDIPVVLMRLREFEHKWFNGALGMPEQVHEDR